MIPCTSKCAYQNDGICTLDSAAAAGVPSLGGACVHFIPQDARLLGSPHRHSEPGANEVPQGPSNLSRNEQELCTDENLTDVPQKSAEKAD